MVPIAVYGLYQSQDKLSSLLKTAENLKVKGLAEVSGEESKAGATASMAPRGMALAQAMPRLAGPPPMQVTSCCTASPPV